MSNYFYTAKNFEGKTKSGFLEASSRNELAKILREEGYILIFAESQENKGWLKFLASIFISKIGGVSLKEKINFASNLSVMINAGLSLNRALEILAEQSESRYFKKIILDIQENVKKGKLFHESLELHPEVFDSIFINMIKVAETVGNLDQILKILSRQLKRDYEIRSKVRGALIYPLIIIGIMIIIGFLMMWFVVPQISNLFKDLKIDLPLSTKIIISISDWMVKFWYLVILIFFALIVTLSIFWKTIISSKFINAIFLHFPIVGSIIKKINSARFSMMLSSLLEGGVSLLNALEIVSHTLTNSFYKKSISFFIEDVKKGKPLNESMQNFKNLYQPMVIQMIKVGEESGALAELLNKVARFFEKEVSNSMRNLSSLIEPILIVLIGLGVGFFALTIIQPIYSLSQAF